MNAEQSERPSGTEPEQIPEKATDMEMAILLISHIDNPCESEVAPGK